jgi:hypothetical protein
VLPHGQPELMLLMRETIRGHQRSSEVISGHQRSSEERSSRGHQEVIKRSSVVISGHQEVISGHQGHQ